MIAFFVLHRLIHEIFSIYLFGENEIGFRSKSKKIRILKDSTNESNY